MLVEFNAVFSTYDTSSVISAFNASDTGIVLIGEQLEWFRRLFAVSDEVHAIHNGAFNPAIGPLVQYWGFTTNRNRWKLNLLRMRLTVCWPSAGMNWCIWISSFW